jgi:hypothetical protein
MPQYTEPVSVRTTRTLLDVIRNYPENPAGSRRWDDRIFHPDENGGPDRPISALWKAPPAYVEHILFCIRVLENAAVERALRRVFRATVVPDMDLTIPGEMAPAEVSSDAISSEVLS